MNKAYSLDLRERVIQSHLEGLPKKVIIVLFKIGMDTLNRWIRQYNNTGNCNPKPRTKYRQRKFSDTDLLNYVELNPSATLEEMAQHFLVKPPSIYVRLKKLGVTRKKKHFFMKKEMRRQDKNLLQS